MYDFEFTRTRIVIRLFAIGTEFVSPSQAKRLVNGLEKSREVVLDFDRVNLVGQGFADEVFRVWSARHTGVELIPIAMNEPVAGSLPPAARTQGSMSGRLLSEKRRHPGYSSIIPAHEAKYF